MPATSFGSDQGWMICLLCMTRHETVDQARECFEKHFMSM